MEFRFTLLFYTIIRHIYILFTLILPESGIRIPSLIFINQQQSKEQRVDMYPVSSFVKKISSSICYNTEPKNGVYISWFACFRLLVLLVSRFVCFLLLQLYSFLGKESETVSVVAFVFCCLLLVAVSW